MLVLERKGNEVFCEGRKLTIVPQATKGPNKEVVKIEGLEGSNGQKWVSLNKLKEGPNELDCQAREVTSSSVGGYSYTQEELEELKQLEARIAEIKAAAKARYQPRFKMLTQSEIDKMTQEEKDAYAEKVMAYIASIKG